MTQFLILRGSHQWFENVNMGGSVSVSQGYFVSIVFAVVLHAVL